MVAADTADERVSVKNRNCIAQCVWDAMTAINIMTWRDSSSLQNIYIFFRCEVTVFTRRMKKFVSDLSFTLIYSTTNDSPAGFNHSISNALRVSFCFHFDSSHVGTYRFVRAVCSGLCLIILWTQRMNAMLKKMLPFPVSFRFGRFSLGRVESIRCWKMCVEFRRLKTCATHHQQQCVELNEDRRWTLVDCFQWI